MSLTLTDRDIRRAAAAMIRRHGRHAEWVATGRAAELEREGDGAGQAAWCRVIAAMDELRVNAVGPIHAGTAQSGVGTDIRSDAPLAQSPRMAVRDERLATENATRSWSEALTGTGRLARQPGRLARIRQHLGLDQ